MKCGHIANSISNNKPACVICDCLEIDEENSVSELLKNRKARCGFYGTNTHKNECSKCGTICLHELNSSPNLAFFEYRGPGSKYEQKCKNCMYFADAHPSQGGTGNYLNSNKKMEHLCENNGKKFEPCVGGLEFDEFYCGCHGWD
jgi:hypothetical protein